MWTFLSGAPRVHTIIVPDLEQARGFYEKVLKLPEAELPLQYYYGYEQSMVGYSLGSPSSKPTPASTPPCSSR
jgi:catechol 2,3-dioxygenase-like lactoylglutathione lyase family enzyme